MTSSSALSESQNFMSSNSEVKQMSSVTGHKSEAMFSQLGSTHQQDFQAAIASSQQQQQQHGEEIKQENLKTQIVSAITDLEKEIVADFDNKENIPGQVKSPTPAKQDIFSPPPLEIMEPPKPVPITVERGFDIHAVNGDFNSLDVKKISKASELHQIEEYNETALTNGSYQESQSVTQAEEYHEDGNMLQKIMRPAPTEYDSGSLKRRDPRKMFTDSSFYSAKHPPTVADQVEMAHRISSALFQEDNKMSKGQNMYLNRAKRSGEVAEDLEVTHQRHDKVPNLKLVMNPEGKVQEWDDIAPEDQPDMSHVATHAAAPISLPSPDIAEAAAGKGGELFAKRRKKAENWVVDEDSVGQSKPSNFADKFMQQQMFQQQQFQQQQQIEQQQKQQIQQQQVQQQKVETSRQQQESRQQFQQQQQIKQEQSLEIRRQQEAETIMNSMNSQQMDLPANFQHFSLKGRSFTPAFDTSCHNVQGINVWANSAPRGWSSQGTAQRVPSGSSAPKLGGPPVVAVCPATPSLEQQQQAALVQQQEEEALLLQRQQEEQLMQQRQQEELLIQQRQQEEQLMQQRQQEEMIRIQQEEQERMRVQQEEQERAQRMAEIQRQEEEARRQQQILEQQRAAELMQQQQAAEALRQQQEA